MIEKLDGMISSLFLPAGKNPLNGRAPSNMFLIPQIFFFPVNQLESKTVDFKHSLKVAVTKTLA